MYKVKFISTGTIFNLVGFNGDKIIIKFNNDLSLGTVPKTGYELLGDKTWKEVEEEIKPYIIKGKRTGRILGKEKKDG